MLSFSCSRVRPLVWLVVPSFLWSLFLHSPTLCIDTLFFPAIERRIPPKFAFFARLLWVVIFAITLLLAWNIGPGAYLFYLHEALPFTPKSVLWGLGVAAILLVSLVFVSDTSRPGDSRDTWIFGAGVIVVVLKILVLAGAIHFPFVHQNVKSPVMANIRLLVSSLGARSGQAIADTPEDTFYSFIKKQEVLPKQGIFMLVESWGEKPDTLAAMAQNIRAQGFQIVTYGFTFYRGATLSGEFRELCGKYVQPTDGLVMAAKDLQCVPQYLSHIGYQTIGVHGYQASFYARSTFWARFGIENRIFADKLQDQSQCAGAFPGVCDENLIRKSVDVLYSAAKPAFVYILTLSSHEPLDPAALHDRGRYFNELRTDHPTQVVTRRAISALVTRLQEQPASPCTLVYLAGDHQPPSASAQGGIFKPGRVPYLAFSKNCPAN